MKITPNELEVLNGIYDSDYRDGNDPVGYPVWSWSANPWEGGPKARSFGGVVTSLVRKGLITQGGGFGREAVVALTKLGEDTRQSLKPVVPEGFESAVRN